MSALAARATRHRPPLWRPAWPRSEPQPPLRRTRRLRRSRSGASRCTKTSGSGRQRTASLATSTVGGSTPTGSIHRSPFRIRCARRVLRSGGSGRSRGSPAARPDVCGARDGGQRAHCVRSRAPLLRTRRTRLRRHGTAVPLRLSLAASSRFAPMRQAPTLLRRCGAGLALYEGPSRVKGWVWLLISLSHPRCGVIRRDRSCPGGVSHTRTLAGVRASRRLPGRTAACG